MATKKKESEQRSSLGVSPDHGDAFRAAAVDISRSIPGGMTKKAVLDAIIEGNEDIWKAVVVEFKRRKRLRRR
jgi:hypothetical protein